MKNEKTTVAVKSLYNATEVCEALGISHHTLSFWYRLERKQLSEGLITESYLPEPIKMKNLRGKPNMWDTNMLEALKNFKANIVTGRNGINGAYTNPNHFNTNKYKKSIETVDKA